MTFINQIIGAFQESYDNGFYSMQNIWETFAAFYGSLAFVITHPTWHYITQFATDVVNVIAGKY